jgi:hypothetical protein
MTITKQEATGHLDRRTVLKGGAAMGLLTLTTPAALAQGRTLRWGSSSLGSSGYVIMEALSQTIRKYTDYQSSSLATAGTSENMALIGRGKLEFGHSTTVDWVAATEGQAPFDGPIELHQMFAYAGWHEPPLVRADSDIMTIEDLAGRRYSPSQPGSGAALLHHELMRAAGLYDQINWSYGTWTEAYDAFVAGQIDAVVGVITNGAPSSNIQQAEAATPLRALAMPEAVLAKAREVNSGILDEMVGPDILPFLEEPIRMPLIGGVAAASPSVTPEAGYDVTKAIFDNAEEVRGMGGPLSGIRLDFAVKNLMASFPVNAGAAQYFQEQGVWRDDLIVAG